MSKYIEKLKNYHKPLTKKMIMLFTLSMIICIVIFVVLILFYNSNKYVVSGGATMYSDGTAIQLQSGAKMTKTIAGDTNIKSGGSSVDCESSFAYLSTKDGIVLTKDMVYYNESTGEFSKVDYFTEVYFVNGVCYAEKGNKKTILDGGFLYDCDDTYVYLESVSLKVAGYTYSISNLSYVDARYEDAVIIFDYASRSQTLFESAGQNCIANLSGGGMVDMFYDTVTDNLGTNVMVVANFNSIESVYNN